MIHSMSRPAIASINLNNLHHNYQLLSRLISDANIMAVVKANAYGHSLKQVAPTLFAAGCRNFGVTDANEGSRLRNLTGHQTNPEITLLSGVFDRDDANLCITHQLIPTITETRQLDLLKQVGFHGSVWIKVDTGMNRLGANGPQSLIKQCQQAGIQICGIMSHLACADSLGHPLNRQQAEAFATLRQNIAPKLPASLLNSAGMISMPEHSLDIVRPGIALYGAEPIPGQPIGLKPVMTLSGQVMQTRQIQAGEHVSYGATFSARKAMSIAVVSLGYGDGLPRALSNRGHAFFNGHKLAIVGHVCMDYTMLDVTAIDIQPGDAVEFWGDNILINDVADMLDTISYSLFTGIGERVTRIMW